MESRCLGGQLTQRQPLQSFGKRRRFSPLMGLYVAGYHISALSLLIQCGIQHRAGLADTFRISKKDF
ncbi:hypothetical protein D3C81_2044790 [compost metagenome]